ncbi:hypothetical protein KXD93_28475 [Mucilaginibacter sp. BJC16-A38]|uniref:hypothetical protein n=1 Tax=Mucilaginibacter phenanthrenivorans TaxID=1234842 RepID=UPI0021589217|nr:hypothetical protein [Mucilaginibacter phenanthrenivorans]MCR8561624.1 hypothetical protein [Mucilaginibacter phenanthrenivorans]
MNKPFYRYFTLVFICVMICRSAAAQTVQDDSINRQHAMANAVNIYNKAIGIQAPVFTGPEFYFYDPHIKGTAFFLDINSFTDGSVIYDGYFYKHVSMLYDLNLDEVVVLLPGRIARFTLLKERVKSFDFANNHFINIKADTLGSDVISNSGYYNQLYNGKIEILGRYTKSIQTTTSTLSGLESYFSSSKSYYLRKNKTYYKIGSQSSILNVLKDKKKELRQYLKTNSIRYKDDPEAAMVKIATWYDHLTN